MGGGLRAVVPLLLVCGCGSKDSRPRKEPDKGSSAARSSPADASLPDVSIAGIDPMTFCDGATRLHRRIVECLPPSAEMANSASSHLANLESMISQATTADAPQSARESTAATCALNALGFDSQLARRTDLTCSAGLTVDERARNRAYLVAYYGRRTKPRPTGDHGLDEQLSKLAAARDVMCKCADLSCVHQAHKTVDAAMKPVPREMQTAADDAMSLLDEVSRCAGSIETGIDKR